MNPLTIQIPLCAENEVLQHAERQAREDAAMEELEARIPGLTALKTSIPTLGLRAVGGRMHLCLTLVRDPQLQLDLAEWELIPGRLIESDPSLLDQHTIAESLRATRMLLARASQREPDAVKEIAEEMRKQLRSRASRRLRQALGQDYTLQVFGEGERIQLPLFQSLSVVNATLRLRLLVTSMRGRAMFKARRIEVLTAPADSVPFSPSMTQVLPCARLDAASTYRSGKLLHESMERERCVLAEGQIVLDVATETVVALQVSAVEVEQAK